MCIAETGTGSKAELQLGGVDLEGKPLQEDLITQEAASKSVHVLGQGLCALPHTRTHVQLSR